MSQERFIRCPHCGMPHEADCDVCPSTQKAIERADKPKKQHSPPPSEENYVWGQHSVHGWSRVEEPRDGDPEALGALVGTLVEEKYRIEALIGRGGMGAVFRAENVRIGKSVAIKVLPRLEEKFERRFLREARIAGSLGHPNIVEVFDLGRLDDGRPFQVMELLEGQTLGDRIRDDGVIAESEVLAIADQVLGALEAAHAKGIVHRDLKPDNVFLDARGDGVRAKLLDFGLSTTQGGEHSVAITMTGAVVGTPHYLAPEQARAEKIDQRADIWAMGVLLYEAVTGRLPFSAKSYPELFAKICRGQPTPPTRLSPRLTPLLEEVILRALAVDASDRYASAAEMREALWLVKRSALEQRIAAFEKGGVAIRQTMQEPDDPTEVSDSFVGADVIVKKES